jgi:hypothetical protein
MKIYIAYEAYPFLMGWRTVKAFKNEDDAKKWCKEENGKVFQEFDDYGLTEGKEYNYFEMELE